MRLLKTLLVTVLVVGLAGAAAYGTGVLTAQPSWRVAERSDAPADEPAPRSSPPPTRRDRDEPLPDAVPRPREPRGPVLAPGDRGRRGPRAPVAALPAGVVPGAHHRPATAPAPREAVRGLPGQARPGAHRRRRPPGPGAGCVAMTKQPTHDQLFNVLHPGPALLARRRLAARRCATCRRGWCRSSGSSATSPARYDAATVEAVRGFQAKREIPVTGEVDQRTLDRLHAMTYQPTYEAMHNIEPKLGALDPRCKHRQRAVHRQVLELAALGGRRRRAGRPTTCGSAPTSCRRARARSRSTPSRATTCRASTTPRCRSRCSSPAARPCTTRPTSRPPATTAPRHGCVNVRDYDGIAWLFDQIDIGDAGDRLLELSRRPGSERSRMSTMRPISAC